MKLDQKFNVENDIASVDITVTSQIGRAHV